MGNNISCDKKHLKVSDNDIYLTDEYRNYYIGVINFISTITEMTSYNDYINHRLYLGVNSPYVHYELYEEFDNIDEDRQKIILKAVYNSIYLLNYSFKELTTYELHCIYVFICNHAITRNYDYSNFHSFGDNNNFCINVTGNNNTKCVNCFKVNNCNNCSYCKLIDDCSDCIECYNCKDLHNCEYSGSCENMTGNYTQKEYNFIPNKTFNLRLV